jgi:O-antigen/teichoic acid export membrane protein
MFLARILTPSDFGIMAVAGAVFAIVSLFIDLGLSNALIYFPAPSPQTRSTLYWLGLGSASLIMLAFVALARPVALLYQEPILLPVMALMSLAMPLAAIGQQFRVLAEKDLRFTKLAIIEVFSASCGFAAALLVALLDGGVYALVAATLVSVIVNSLLAWIYLSDGVRPILYFNLRDATDFVRYGSYRLGETLFSSLQTQADVLIGGALVGSSAMGVYTVPRDLSLKLANTVINPVVTRVGLPIMAKVQSEPAALKAVYLQTLRMTSSVNFPAYFALALWADEAVAILLGTQWDEAAFFMRLFAVWGLIRSTGNPLGSLLYATGRVRQAFWWTFVVFLAIPLPLYFGATLGGMSGLAAVMVGLQLLIFFPLYKLMVLPALGVSFAEYVGELLPALIASTVAGALGFICSSLLFPQNIWTRSLCGGVVFAAAYVAASLAINRPWVANMKELLRPAIRRNR